MSDLTQDGSQSSRPLGGRDDPGLLAKILETSLVGITVVDAEGQFFFANRKAEEILCLTKSEITSRVYNDPEWHIATFDGGHFPDEELPFQKVRDTGKAVEHVRHAIVWPDGRMVCLSINAFPLADANGGFAGIVAGIEDISAAVESERALERQNRANRVLTQCNQALIRAADETSLLEKICRIVVEDGGYRLAWVGYAEEDVSKTVKPVAQCGFEEGYLDAISITWDETVTGLGPTGTAIRTGQPAHARNILSDPAYAPWRDEALKHGYASSLALPLIINSHTLGALNIYAAEPDAFDFEEKRLLLQMAGDLAYGITTLRARKERKQTFAELKESREDWQRIFNSISNVVMILDLEQNILAANPATEKKLDLSLDRILGRKCYEVFHLLDEAAEGCPFKSLVEAGGAVAIEEMEIEMEAVVGTFIETVSPIFDAQGRLSKVLHIAKDITDRKKMEQELRDSEERLRVTLEETQIGIWDWDMTKDIWHASPTYFTMLGYEPKAGHDDRGEWLDLFHPSDRDEADEIINDVLNGDKSKYQYEARIKHADGSYRWHSIIGHTVEWDEDRKPVRMVGVRIDIDERKQAEAEREQYSRLFQGAADLMVIADPNGAFLKTNPHCSETLGYSEAELIAKPFIEFVHPDDKQETLDEMARQLKTGASFNFENRYLCKDGSIRWLSWRATYNKNDGLTYATARDVTEHKQAEDKLRYQAAQLAHVNDAIVGSDAQYRLTTWNTAAEALYGWKAKEVLGQNGLEICRTEWPAVDTEDMRRSIDAMGYWRGEATQQRKDGMRFPVEISSIALRDDSGQITGYVSVNRDITERKLAEEKHGRLREQLQQSQKMESVGRLAGGVAHDFNNYLTAVEGYIDLTLQDLPESGRERVNLLEARHSAERAANLTRQLLLFSRREPMELKLVHLNTIVIDLLKMLERLIGEQYSILSSLDDDLLPVKADAGQIEQVLMNLMINARDAMHDGGEIEIGTTNMRVDETYVQSHLGTRAGEFVRLYVRDSGSGMDADTLSHIFEPFFSTKKTGYGTGLGLSVVYGIITQHGGWIDAESKPGSGSTFSIFLPSVPLEVAEADAETIPTGELRGHGEKILLVEDDEPVRVLAEKMLSSHNYDVVFAASAEEALDLFEEESGEFDLVFSDVILPGMDGIRLIERLIDLKPGLRVLLASGFVEGVIFQTIREKGYRFLEKPYALTDLLRQVREVLEGPTA